METESKKNPSLYRKLSEPHSSRAEANENMKNFFQAVSDAREKYKVRDVVMTCEDTYVGEDENESDFSSTLRLGDSTKHLLMIAQLYGEMKSDYNEILGKITKSK